MATKKLTPKAPVYNPIFDRKAETGKQRRPDHPDFRTTSEHKAAKFTGIRKNDMVMEWEFWILGSIVERVHYQTLINDPHALTKAHVKIFKMNAGPESFK